MFFFLQLVDFLLEFNDFGLFILERVKFLVEVRLEIFEFLFGFVELFLDFLFLEGKFIIFRFDL